MSLTELLTSDAALRLGPLAIPVWALWAVALLVVLVIVSIIIVRLIRRARKITRATNDTSQAADGDHTFGSYGAVTSAISITPDVKRRSRGNGGSTTDD
ncbi:hypothetical protein [Brevibacterium zhoupengii]|uniref:hypothetical protein n=1 Tax=Brevibacterium zhoupengii TaxID=2898795 RepID=UPI001E2BC871|nr:hypothetical protein [Brevibacterium zhoupengii]